jgi:hypothetical protein
MATGTAPTTRVDPDKLAGLAAERFRALPRDCDRAEPGLVDSEPWRDWTRIRTTLDQLRIEDYLDLQDLRGRRILHVGIGNSQLARRFHARAREIVGTSIVAAEVANGRSLGLANYRPVLHNKYGGRAAGIEGRFDFIVDNNPSSFSCCLGHFAAMLDFYAGRLGDEGVLITDRVGLAWTDLPGGSPRWSFSFDDLAAAGGIVGLQASRLDRNLYALANRRLARLPAGARLKLLARDIRHRAARSWR